MGTSELIVKGEPLGHKRGDVAAPWNLDLLLLPIPRVHQEKLTFNLLGLLLLFCFL